MTILDDIRTDIAQLEKLVPTPTEPFGYGVDLACVDDLTEDMQEVDGFSRQGLAESCIRFLTTDRDSIPDAPGRGWNVRRLLNRAFTASELAAQEGLAAAELEQDDRIVSATVTLEIVRKTRTVNMHFTVEAEDPALGTFEFTAAVTDGDALLELLS